MIGTIAVSLGLADQRLNIIPHLINENKFSTYAEVGVATCRLSEKVLSNCPTLSKALLIDAFDLLKEFEGLTDEENTARLTHAQQIAARYPITTVVKSLSTEAAKHVPDDSLEFIFIDADHTYNAVKEDIAAWLPKVKKGGILSGHDFALNFIGVIMAVHEAFPDRYIHLEKDAVWWVRV